MNTHQAVMFLSRELFEGILPPGKVIDCVADKVGPVDYAWLAEALLLPPGTRVTGVSVALRFCYDQIAVRVESADFLSTPPDCLLPQVQALYCYDAAGKAAFVSWMGPAVGHARTGSQTTPAEIDRRRARDEALRQEMQRAFQNGVNPCASVKFVPPAEQPAPPEARPVKWREWL